MKTGIIIPVRSTSTRLPRKHKRLVNGLETLLSYLVRRLARLNLPIIIAKPLSDYDYCRGVSQAAHFAWGEEENVLGRLVAAAKEADIHRMIIVHGDSPLTGPDTVQLLLDNQVGSILQVNGPSGFRPLAVYTFFAECWDDYLKKAREHVFEQPPHTLYKSIDVLFSEAKFSIDTEEDLKFVRAALTDIPDGKLVDYVQWAEHNHPYTRTS